MLADVPPGTCEVNVMPMFDSGLFSKLTLAFSPEAQSATLSTVTPLTAGSSA